MRRFSCILGEHNYIVVAFITCAGRMVCVLRKRLVYKIYRITNVNRVYRTLCISFR